MEPVVVKKIYLLFLCNLALSQSTTKVPASLLSLKLCFPLRGANDWINPEGTWRKHTPTEEVPCSSHIDYKHVCLCFQTSLCQKGRSLVSFCCVRDAGQIFRGSATITELRWMCSTASPTSLSFLPSEGFSHGQHAFVSFPGQRSTKVTQVWACLPAQVCRKARGGLC